MKKGTKHLKRNLSILIALTLVLGCISVQVFASERTSITVLTTSDYYLADDSDLTLGSSEINTDYAMVNGDSYVTVPVENVIGGEVGLWKLEIQCRSNYPGTYNGFNVYTFWRIFVNNVFQTVPTDGMKITHTEATNIPYYEVGYVSLKDGLNKIKIGSRTGMAALLYIHSIRLTKADNDLDIIDAAMTTNGEGNKSLTIRPARTYYGNVTVKEEAWNGTVRTQFGNEHSFFENFFFQGTSNAIRGSTSLPLYNLGISTNTRYYGEVLSVVLRDRNYITIPVPATKEGRYLLSANYGANSPSNYNTVKTIVTNGENTDTIWAPHNSGTGDYYSPVEHVLGNILLRPGINYIKIDPYVMGFDAIFLNTITLKPCNPITTIDANQKTITTGLHTLINEKSDFRGILHDATFKVSSITTGVTDNDIFLTRNNKATFAVKAPEKGKYKITINSGSRYLHRHKIKVNGVTQAISDVFNETGAYTTFASEEAGYIYLDAGINEIEISLIVNSTNSDAIYYQSFTLDKVTDLVSVSDFEFKDINNNYTAPNVLSNVQQVKVSFNLEAYDNLSDTAILFAAQYDSSGMLLGIEKTNVNLANLTPFVKSEYSMNLNLQQGYEDGYIKGFIFDNATIKPYCTNIMLEEYDFFDSSVLSNTVTYDFTGDASISVPGGEINPITYTGSVYNGNPTSVFGYIGIPSITPPAGGFPAVVLVHGAGGNADREWIANWIARGYVAIAMDLYGNDAEGIRLVDAGVENPFDYLPLSQGAQSSSMYHTVINIINANTLLRSLSIVNENKIGINGIAQGGIVASTVIGVDNRFSFATPIYSSSYLYNNSIKASYQSYAVKAAHRITLGPDENCREWDPSNFIKKAQMPMLFVASDTDYSSSLDIMSKTYELFGNVNSIFTIKHNLAHSQVEGRNVPEAYDFADAVCMNDINGYFIKIQDVTVVANAVTVNLSRAAVDASLFYNSDEVLPFMAGDISWTEIPDTNGRTSYSFALPEEAKRFYLTVNDGYTLSSSKLYEIE